MNKQADTVQDNSKRLGWIENIITHQSEGTNTLNETNVPSCVDFATLNKTVIAIEVNIDKQTEITRDVLHNYTTRVTELGIDMYVHRNSITQLTKAVSELNDTMKQLESVEMENNDSLNNNEETIHQLEANIEIHDTRLTKLETNDIMNHATLVAHISEVAKLQSDQLNDRDITTNLTFRVLRLETVVEKQNYSEELENRVIQLVLNINKLQTDIKENGNEINVLNENITSIQDIVNDFNETLEKVKVI